MGGDTEAQPTEENNLTENVAKESENKGKPPGEKHASEAVKPSEKVTIGLNEFKLLMNKAVDHLRKLESMGGESSASAKRKEIIQFLLEDADIQGGSGGVFESEEALRREARVMRLVVNRMVKKDLDHDKSNRRRVTMNGLQRAMSSVRIAENSQAKSASPSAVARQQSKARTSTAKIGRLVSLPKEREQKAEKKHDRAEQEASSEHERSGHLQRSRKSTASKPGMGQGYYQGRH